MIQRWHIYLDNWSELSPDPTPTITVRGIVKGQIWRTTSKDYYPFATNCERSVSKIGSCKINQEPQSIFVDNDAQKKAKRKHLVQAKTVVQQDYVQDVLLTSERIPGGSVTNFICSWKVSLCNSGLIEKQTDGVGWRICAMSHPQVIHMCACSKLMSLWCSLDFFLLNPAQKLYTWRALTSFLC